MDNLKHTPAARAPRTVHTSGGLQTIARVDLSRPGSAEALREVTNDWLYTSVGVEGKRKLLAEHELLAA